MILYRDIKTWPASVHKPSVAMPDNGIKVKLRYRIEYSKKISYVYFMNYLIA